MKKAKKKKLLSKYDKPLYNVLFDDVKRNKLGYIMVSELFLKDLCERIEYVDYALAHLSDHEDKSTRLFANKLSGLSPGTSKKEYEKVISDWARNTDNACNI